MAKNTMEYRIEARLRLMTASEFHARIHEEDLATLFEEIKTA